jgi:hypothetical protein
MNQTGIAASEETVSSCTRTDVFTAFGCDRASSLPATHSPERLTAAILNFHPLPVCDRVRQIRSAVILRLSAKHTQQESFGSHTAIGTHSRFTRQLLGYAQRDRLARTLFYDFPVTPMGDDWQQKKAASLEAAFFCF